MRAQACGRMRLFLLPHNRRDRKALFVFFKHNLVGIEKSILSEDAVNTQVGHECTRNGKGFCCCLQTQGDLMLVGMKGLIARYLDTPVTERP